MECRWRLSHRSWPRWLAALGIVVAAMLIVWAGTGTAAPPEPPCPSTATNDPTSGADSTTAESTGEPTSAANAAACPAGYTCVPAHANRDGKRVIGIFVVLDGSDDPDPTTPSAATTTATPTRAAMTSSTTPRSTHSATPTRAAPAHSASRRATHTGAPTPSGTAAELPGAVDLDAAQRRAEACGAGYGCPVPTPGRATGVVPAPGCTGATAHAPDGRCS